MKVGVGSRAKSREGRLIHNSDFCKNDYLCSTCLAAVFLN